MAPPKATSPAIEIEVGDRDVRISNPDRVYFPARGETKLDLVNYYLSVGDGIVNALRERPCMMHRFPEGVAGEKVHQKRVPNGAPPWLETVRVTFPRYNRTADELCVTELAHVIWAVQMSTVEFHPWNSRRADTEKPDEWRIDLDPMPDCPFDRVRSVAHVAHEVLDELGAVGWPKTSGGNGLHIYVRIDPQWGFKDVRRAALAFAREVERRAPDDVTTTWWRRDRDPTRALRRLQPERPRPHDRQRLLGARQPRGARSRPRSAGTRSTTSNRARSPSRRCPSGMPPWVTFTRASTTRSSRSTPCWSGRSGTSARAPKTRAASTTAELLREVRRRHEARRRHERGDRTGRTGRARECDPARGGPGVERGHARRRCHRSARSAS